MFARKVKFVLGCAFSVLIVSALAACSQSTRSTQPSPERQQYFTHTVQYSGETLANISKWYTGQPSNWTIIQEANPSMNPRKLRIGSTVQIPQSLIVRAEAFPRPKTTQVVRQETPDLEPASERSPSAPTTEFAYPDSPTGTSQVAGVTDDNSSPVAAAQGDLPTSPDLVVAENPDLTDRASTGEFSDTSIQSGTLGDDTVAGTSPSPQNKTGIVSGLLEAVGNAAINAKQQESTPASK